VRTGKNGYKIIYILSRREQGVYNLFQLKKVSAHTGNKFDENPKNT